MSEAKVMKVDTPTGGVALRMAGSGPALVFLHGLGGSSRSWARQLEALSDSRQVIAWDCPGYGDSDDFPGGEPQCADYAKALLAALDKIDVGAFDLVGHSMGGAIAPWAARLAPLRVRRLVLSATRVAFALADTTGFEAGVADRRHMDDATFGKSRAKGMVGEASPVFAEIAAVAGKVREPGYAAAVHLLKHADNRALLPTIAQPTLVLAGENDPIAPADATKAVAAAVPGARLETIPGTAHAAYMEKPEIYNRLLREFLDA